MATIQRDTYFFTLYENYLTLFGVTLHIWRSLLLSASPLYRTHSLQYISTLLEMMWSPFQKV